MELKQRKRINNQSQLQHFVTGTDVGSLNGMTNHGTYDGYGQFHYNGMTNNGAPYSVSTANTMPSNGITVPNSFGNTNGGASAVSNVGGYVNGGIQAIQGGLQIAENNAAANSQVRDSRELQQVAGTYDVQGSGYSFQKQNSINEANEWSRMHDINAKTTVTNTAIGIGAGAGAGLAIGASIGSGAGPIGAGIGAVVGALAGLTVGIVGGKHRRNKLRKAIVNAQNTINRNNNFYESSAQTNYLAQQYDADHTNTQNDTLYTAHHGKDLKQPIIKK